VPLPALRRTAPSRRRRAAVAAARAVTALRPQDVALLRTGAGVLMLARPQAVPDLLGADPDTSRSSGWVMQMLGAREVALGLGALAGLSGPGRRTWLAAGLLSDGTDVLVLTAALAARRIGRTPARAVLTVGATAGAVVAACSQGRALRRG
jgi:hypothetical protein